jgi:hypothetical protein
MSHATAAVLSALLGLLCSGPDGATMPATPSPPGTRTLSSDAHAVVTHVSEAWAVLEAGGNPLGASPVAMLESLSEHGAELTEVTHRLEGFLRDAGAWNDVEPLIAELKKREQQLDRAREGALEDAPEHPQSAMAIPVAPGASLHPSALGKGGTKLTEADDHASTAAAIMSQFADVLQGREKLLDQVRADIAEAEHGAPPSDPRHGTR